MTLQFDAKQKNIIIFWRMENIRVIDFFENLKQCDVTVWRFIKTWRTCSHERRSCDVIGEMERIADDLQNRNEEIVADDRQRQDQVRRDDDVDDDPALGLM